VVDVDGGRRLTDSADTVLCMQHRVQVCDRHPICSLQMLRLVARGHAGPATERETIFGRASEGPLGVGKNALATPTELVAGGNVSWPHNVA
jgi:hypothetical protein